jgi:hypothetical protein
MISNPISPVTFWILLALGILKICHTFVAGRIRLTRERSALDRAAHVYKSGGDAADVLRALSERAGEVKGEPPLTPDRFKDH